MLKVEGIHVYYGLSHILFEVSLEVHPGEVVCLLGRNGAGKSTTMRGIMGLNPPRQGKVLFEDQDLSGKKPFEIARLGLGYVPDDRRVFADLTVAENLDIVEGVSKRKPQWTRDRLFEFFPPLAPIAHRKAGLLSGGEQQMLTIARALMTNPKLLLLDEPTEGLAPLVVKTLEEQISSLKEAGLTVLLAEQNQKMALRLSDRAYVIDNGSIRYHGTIQELRENDEVRRKYLLV
ncbi:ABC transporter ATP-binding protein [Desulfogranum japonicum]|uniref:ABC transporter ATP-binding protein n=1 Tax=Desulfogranum japonicum TaxID=231447 RepID=UPI0004274C80|nr:ABC transporter ATP-binding protein [Desulfogranum japonicum]